MLALRNLARSTPRSAARLSTKAIRPQPSLFRQATVFHPSWSQAAPKLTSSFHMSALRRQENGSGLTEELVAKLQAEINMEEDANQEDDLTTNIKEYLDNSPFQIEDKPGSQEVVLTRTFGEEKIRIVFSTADLNNNPPEEFDDSTYDDVDLETQSGGANSKGAVSQGKTSDGNISVGAEDGVANEEFDEGLEDQGFPAHINITIERAGKGALAIEATAQDGDILVEEIYHFPSADLADPATADKEWQRRTLYSGPPFNNLDEDLQILLEKYLEERGINTRLALFIPDYIDYKEQKEYVTWLNNLKKFVA